MGYRMEYGMTDSFSAPSQKSKKNRNKGLKKWILLGLVMTLIGVCVVTDVLIPGDKTVTKSAMSELVSDVRDGEQVVDAFAAFCQTVLQGG